MAAAVRRAENDSAVYYMLPAACRRAVIAVAFAGHSRVEMASTIYSTMLLMKA